MKTRLSAQVYEILAEHTIRPKGARWALKRARQIRDKLIDEAMNDTHLSSVKKAEAVQRANDSYLKAVQALKLSADIACMIEQIAAPDDKPEGHNVTINISPTKVDD